MRSTTIPARLLLGMVMLGVVSFDTMVGHVLVILRIALAMDAVSVRLAGTQTVGDWHAHSNPTKMY